MTSNQDSLTIAEKYLDEMIKADKEKNYDAFIQRFEPDELEGFTIETFEKDIEHMREDFGSYVDRSYLGSVKGDQEKHKGCQRFIWKGIYEKKEIIIAVGVYQKDGVWYANENMCY